MSTLNQKQQVLLDTVRKFVRLGATNNLDKLLARRRPEEVAALLPHLSERDARQLLTDVLDRDLTFGAHICAEADSSLVRSILESLPRERLVQLISALPPDDAANLMRLLPEPTSEEILPLLAEKRSEEVGEILAYAPDSAGGLMNPEYFALSEDSTVAEAIHTLQSVGDQLEMTFYIYIINGASQLVGVLSLRSLLTRAPETLLKNLMITEVLSVHASTDQEEVARVVARYNLLAIPVIDDFNRLLGIVTVDDVIDVLREEATEDILQMVGASEEDLGARSTRRSVRARAPWATATLLVGLLTSEIICVIQRSFEDIAFLAAFLPAIVGIAINAGSQSAALIARGISTSRLEARTLWRYFFRELRVGLALGFLSSAILTTFITLRYPELGYASLAYGVSAFLAMLASIGVGSLCPLLFQRIHLDPGTAAGPFISIVTNLIGTTMYVATATALIHYLNQIR